MASWIVCETCNHVDMSTLTNPPVNGLWQCSLCHPNKLEWHGCFERAKYDPTKHNVINRIKTASNDLTISFS